jgi:hypothetical protein
MYKHTQLLLDVSSSKLLDYQVALGQSLESSNLDITMNYGISYSGEHLFLQSEIFANELVTRSNINFKHVTGFGHTQPGLLNLLSECYIYSYAKALILGLKSSDIRNLPSSSPLFIGHGIFHRLLQRSRFALKKDDCSLYLNIKVTKEETSVLLNELISDFKFLGSVITETSSGNVDVFSSKHDSVLSHLCDVASNVSDNKLQLRTNSNDILNSDTSENSSSATLNTREDANYHTDPVNRDQSRGNFGKAEKVKFGMRMFEIVDLSDSILDSFLTDDSLPLGNSALNILNNDKWYYTNNPTQRLKNSVTSHLCRANFIYLIEDGSNNLFEDETYMSQLPRVFKKDILLPKDVRAVTYLKCDRLPNIPHLLEERNRRKLREFSPMIFSPEYHKYKLNLEKRQSGPDAEGQDDPKS